MFAGLNGWYSIQRTGPVYGHKKLCHFIRSLIGTITGETQRCGRWAEFTQSSDYAV